MFTIFQSHAVRINLTSFSNLNIHPGVQSAGRAMRDNIAAGFSGFPGFGFVADMIREEVERVGRSLWGEEVESLANTVKMAVEVYTNLNKSYDDSVKL